MKTITCKHCTAKHHPDRLKRLCGNCFACTGCKIYQCPACGKRIVVAQIKQPDMSSA